MEVQFTAMALTVSKLKEILNSQKIQLQTQEMISLQLILKLHSYSNQLSLATRMPRTRFTLNI